MWLARAGSVGLATIMVLTFCDVIGRYVFNNPIVGTVEVTELLMGMIVYLGVGLTTQTRGHIRVDIVINLFSPRTRALLDVLTLSLSILLVFLMCWHLWLKAGIIIDKNDLTQIWEWPVWPAAYVMAAASLLMLTSLIFQLLHGLNDLMQNASTPGKP